MCVCVCVMLRVLARGFRLQNPHISNFPDVEFSLSVCLSLAGYVCVASRIVVIVIVGLYRRNKRHLENEIARGMGKSLDPIKLAEELYWREEGRKVR